MKKKYRVILSLIITVSIFIIGYIVFNNKYEQSNIKNPNTINLSEVNATKMFQQMYGMPNLQNQNVYILDNTLYVDFYFSKEATDSEIDSARSFALMTFVLEKSSPWGEIPYMSLVDKGQKEVYWEQTVCDIYKKNKKIWYEKYKGMELETSEQYFRSE